jgi:hypothetical protein
MSSIKRDVKKKVLPRPEGEKILSRDPAHCSGLAAGVSEVSRFSCMKLLGVSGVFDYAGLNRNSR